MYVHTDDPPTSRLGILGLLVIWPVASVAFALAAGRDTVDAERVVRDAFDGAPQ